MREDRPALDVSGLPSVVFGPASLPWWGTIGFMVIEGFTLALMVASYLYLRLNEHAWPPPPTDNPDLLIPTINTLLILAIILPMRRSDAAAHRFDRMGVIRWTAVAGAMSVVAVVLRWFDLVALDARWDEHAYASAAWGVVVLHGTLLLLDVLETTVIVWLFATHRAERKHYSDVSDAALYQYFLSLGWIPAYLIIYWGPRVL